VNRTDSLFHFSLSSPTCESLDSRDEIEKILNLGVCILHGSQKTSANELLKRIEVAIAKVKVIAL
jgi:hypothetical protein